MERDRFIELQQKGCNARLFKNPIRLEPAYESLRDKENPLSLPRPYDRTRKETCYLQIVSSVSDEVTPENSEHLLRLLRSIKEPLSFEIIGSSSEIIVTAVCQSRDKNLVTASLETQYQHISVQELNKDPIHAHYQSLKKNGPETEFNFLDFYLPPPYYLPVITFTSKFNKDPLEPIYHTLSTLEKEELGFYQVLFVPTRNDWHKNIREMVGYREVVEKTSLGRSRTQEGHPFLSDPELRFLSKLSEEKANPSKPFFAASIRAGVFALPNRFGPVLNTLKAGMDNFSSGTRGFRYLTRKEYFQSGLPKKDHLYIFFNRVSFREGMLLNSLELAGLCHLPIPQILVHSDYKVVSTPRAVRAPEYLNQRVCFGVNLYRGVKREVRLNQGIRNKHCYIVGKTRMGKSTLMLNLVYQDILNGECVVVIDPEGDLIDEVLAVIPEKRIDEVVYFNAGDKDFPVSFNPLHAGRHRERGKLCNDILTILGKLFDDPLGERMKRILRKCLLCLLYLPESTLKDTESFFNDDKFREKVLTNVYDQGLKDYWHTYFPLKKKLLWSSVEAIFTRLDGFLGDERIRNITCQRKNRIDFDEILDQKRILLCNLATKKIGQANANLLGQLIVSELQIAGMHREKDNRKDVYLYVDEFQNYITPDFSILLSQGAKHRVNLTLAHQYVEQLRELKGAVSGTVGSMVAFRLGERDAPIFAKEFGIFSEQEIIHLPAYHTLVKVEDKCFTMITNPPPTTGYNFREEIIRKSREKYARSKEEVEKEFRVTLRAEAKATPFKKEVEVTEESEQALRWPPPPHLPSEDMEQLEGKGKSPSGLKETRERAKGEPLLEGEQRVLSSQEKELLISISREESNQNLMILETSLGVPEKKLRSLMESLGRKGLVETIPGERGQPQAYFLTKKGRALLSLPASQGKGGPQHKYLQALIKKMAEAKGYRAIIEQELPDGSGSVDVGLEGDRKRIACEISITSTGEQELSNIEKCLAAGYEKVVLCAQEKKILDKVKALTAKKLTESDQEKVRFMQPEELVFFLDEEAAKEAGKEERVKGYRVKVQYQPVRETEKKTKREAVAQVISQAMRRLKGGGKGAS